MQSRLLTAMLLSAVAFGVNAGDDGRPAWHLRAAIAGEALVGEWELSQSSSGGSGEEVLSGALVSQVGVAQGATFQIQVKLVDPSGVVTDVTGSPKLMYRPKACLTVAANGSATVAQAPDSLWPCDKGAPIPLTIIYADQSAGVAAINMYLMKVD
ncbi:hypothetical protein [Stenotrophomonas sp. GZD-301]|uniref:hypothetical protein n=1 Tax=Stenotrophomonas sp. GZD-301 TaxID=3404814 RepID=UPI003BB71A83